MKNEIEVTDEAGNDKMGIRRRGGSREKKCKGKNNVAGERDKNWGR